MSFTYCPHGVPEGHDCFECRGQSRTEGSEPIPISAESVRLTSSQVQAIDKLLEGLFGTPKPSPYRHYLGKGLP